MQRAFGRGTNGQTRDSCREHEHKRHRRIHRPTHSAIDAQFLDPSASIRPSLRRVTVLALEVIRYLGRNFAAPGFLSLHAEYW